MIEIEVFCVWLDPRPDGEYVVIFKEKHGNRALPMAIGVHEAHAIQYALEGQTFERPMTHDLLVNCIDGLDAECERVEVKEYRDGTYYADVVLSRDGEIYRVDARPSDCAALALRSDAPLFATEEVIEEADATLVEENGMISLVTGQGRHRVPPQIEGDDQELDAFRRIISEVNLDDDDS